MSHRAERLASEIRRVVCRYIMRDTQTHISGFVTVMDVTVTPDLSVAKIYYSVFGDEKQIAQSRKVIDEETKFMRQAVAKEIRLRLVPELVFVFDDTEKKAAYMEQMLKKVLC